MRRDFSKRIVSLLLVLVLVITGGCSAWKNDQTEVSKPKAADKFPPNPNTGINYEKRELNEIWVAGGCFWSVEAYMSRIYGVADVTVGYANGSTDNPTYEDVCYRNSGHAETAYVRYDPERTDLKTLLQYYFKSIDPTLKDRQANDRGTQYRTGIYYRNEDDLPVILEVMEQVQKQYDKPVVTEVLPLKHYSEAESYHQDYLQKNPHGYSHIDYSPLFDQQFVNIPASLYTKPEEAELRQRLTPDQFAITQMDSTEPAFRNAYWDNHEPGLYVDIVTGEPLFISRHKFDSGTGWPSFTRPIAGDVVTYLEDSSFGYQRIEVRSRAGDSHLGHVFNDGPAEEGGLRFCINSGALRFIPLAKMKAEGYEDYILLIE